MLNNIININDIYTITTIIIVVILALLVKKFFNLTNKEELNKIINGKSNVFAIRFAAILFGVIYASSGEIFGGSIGLFNDIISFFLYSILMFILIFIAVFIGDKLLLSEINNIAALKKGNTAVALFELCYIIATSMTARATLIGDGGSVISVLLFFILGQTVLILFFLIALKLTPFDDVKEISKNNIAASLFLGGLLLAISVINYYSLLGDSTEMLQDAIFYIISAIKGGVLLLLFGYSIDKIIFPKVNITNEVIEKDKNWGLIFIVSMLTIAVSIIIGANL
ncbi:uncharacterized membrane protein YjfL (UPF0719 family) [Hypnocyclicus thermotrophus]|uniref:Uncharacterized membrane protein YjfL (UPF0719 family) n=1 Tax=Hypnocyclicus thermotrophus TaxID=1627895 RepID=A0AA46E010_9FUSO|nr:DUF350 domain-containing protein [Hypnocyclicus thermotrophus]TDT72304.1 uncharacterized membrane protein YjfL (UPF0719 family) [Hypnocyclicus thermotrophus]